MDDFDAYPTRDSGGFPPAPKNKLAQDDALAKRSTQQKNMVTRLSRDELEDKYIRMYEENLLLKKHARKQEEKIKKMATKLLRLYNDKKKQESANAAKKGAGGRDIETEEMLEDLHSKIAMLEKQNHQYKEKLSVLKQQLATQNTRKSAYGYVQSRISTGIQKPPPEPHIAKQLRVAGPSPSATHHRTHTSSPYPRCGQSVLEQERSHSQRLQNIIDELNESITMYEQDIMQLNEQMRMRETEYEEDILKIKQQLSQGQRTAIQENIDSIRLQREVKEKSTKLTQLQGKYAQLEEKLRAVKTSHDQVLMEMEVLNDQLKLEQNRVLGLQNELKSTTSSQRAITEYKERCTDLERECEILKEANEKLVASAFDLEREREWKQKENALKVQIAQLEATLRADVGEKGSILDRLNSEREEHDKMEEDLREMRVKYFQMKQENDELRDKMRFFTQESAVDFQEIEEALVIVKQRKEKANQDLDFLRKVDDESSKDLSKMVRELQAEHAETINELEKTRNMLIVQHKINKDYQQEVEAVTSKKEELVKEYDTKLDEYAALLDIRANRIKKLEAQLRDVAYGTRQYRVTTTDEGAADSDDETAIEETLHLERGQNLFEIHVSKVSLSTDAVRELGDEEPHLFATWEFFEHEVQATPVVKGQRPNFHFTSQYIVKVDDFFLHYLQKDSCTLELHQSFGTDYRTVAACQLKMRDILDKPQGRLHGTAQLTGTGGSGIGPGTNFGVVEYWVRLKVPMEQALRLFKERTKALGYMNSNIRATEQALQAMDESANQRPPDNVNQITLTLKFCNGLTARREGIQPSAYCVYKFFDFADHVTATIPGSNNPQFNDSQVYNVPMTSDLDKYIKTQRLHVYVFDDTDPDQTAYLGAAQVPLIQLAHNKPIAGIFELFSADGNQNGTIDLSLKWRFNYIPPISGTRTAKQMLASGADLHQEMSLLPGEDEAMKEVVQAGGPGTKRHSPRTPQKMKSRPPPGPAAHSTPMAAAPPPTTTHRRSPPTSTAHSPPPHEDSIHSDVGSAGMSRHGVNSQVSIVSEGTPVPGEDESLSEDIDEEPPSISAQPLGPQDEASTQNGEVSITEVEKDESQNSEVLGDDTLDKSPDQLIAEELGETFENKNSDTMFGDPSKEDESDAESNRSRITHSETESEVVMLSPDSKNVSQLRSLHAADTVQVSINHLSFHDNAPIYNARRNVSKLFVEYRFLDVAPEETETPYALPKPKPGRGINFNFTKIFHVDYENFYERRQYLASMLLPEDPLDGKVKLTVVSEPEDEDGECEDVGKCYVSVREVLQRDRDFEEHDFDIVDAEDEAVVIGTLNVTVKCLEALKAVQAEMGESAA